MIEDQLLRTAVNRLQTMPVDNGLDQSAKFLSIQSPPPAYQLQPMDDLSKLRNNYVMSRRTEKNFQQHGPVAEQVEPSEPMWYAKAHGRVFSLHKTSSIISPLVSNCSRELNLHLSVPLFLLAVINIHFLLKLGNKLSFRRGSAFSPAFRSPRLQISSFVFFRRGWTEVPCIEGTSLFVKLTRDSLVDLYCLPNRVDAAIVRMAARLWPCGKSTRDDVGA